MSAILRLTSVSRGKTEMIDFGTLVSNDVNGTGYGGGSGSNVHFTNISVQDSALHFNEHVCVDSYGSVAFCDARGYDWCWVRLSPSSLDLRKRVAIQRRCDFCLVVEIAAQRASSLVVILVFEGWL